MPTWKLYDANTQGFNISPVSYDFADDTFSVMDEYVQDWDNSTFTFSTKFEELSDGSAMARLNATGMYLGDKITFRMDIRFEDDAFEVATDMDIFFNGRLILKVTEFGDLADVDISDDSNALSLVFSLDDTIVGNSYGDLISGYAGNDKLYGGLGNDKLYGGNNNDKLYGGTGNDSLWGDSGKDSLQGDAGKDRLTGGSGADSFIFRAVSESATGDKTADVITDFVIGSDKINLSAIDASTKLSGNNDFVFKGTTKFATSTDGEIYYKKFNNSGTANDYTMVYIDNDNDSVVEMAIRLTGLHTLSASDFIL